MTDNVLTTVFKLHTLGYSVIPSGGGESGKAPLLDSWTPYQDNQPDDTLLNQWQDSYHPVLWGIVTGERAGVVVVGPDNAEARAILESAGLKPHVITPHGAHFYFKHPGHNVKNAANLLPGLDIRGDGGFVNCIGRNPITGGEYQVVKLPTPENLIPWSKLPKRILAALNGGKPAPKAKQGAVIPDGERNATFASLAGTMRRRGMTTEAIYAALIVTPCEHPLSEAEVRKIAESVGRYEPTRGGNRHKPEQAKAAFNWREHTIEHSALIKKELPPIEFTIKDLVPLPGLIALAGRKKKGKSWMVLQMSQGVASTNGKFLDRDCQHGRVIHMALEDGERRLRQRLEMQGADSNLPITYITEWPALNTLAGMSQLKEMLLEIKPILLVIDTLSAAKNKMLDENDAGIAGDLFNELHALTIACNVSIVLVMHHGKMQTGDTGFDIRGSSAISGATDVNIGLYKLPDESYELRTEGRDIADQEIKVKLDTEVTWCWQYIGDAKDLRRVESEDRIIACINDLGGEADAEAIAREIDISRPTASTNMKRMSEHGLLGRRLENTGRGRRVIYTLSPTNPTNLHTNNNIHT